VAQDQWFREVAKAETTIASNLTSGIDTPVRAVDRVASFGAVTALIGVVALPFVESRANRLVAGTSYRAWGSAGLVGWVLVALALAGLVAATLPPRWRGRAVLAAGVAGFSAWVVALGFSAGRLMPAGDSPVRVSLALGAWLSLVGIAIVWFAGSGRVGSRRLRAAATGVGIAVVAATWFLGGLSKISLVYEYHAQSDIFWTLVANHVGLSLGGTAIAAVLGIPLGIAAARRAAVRATVIPVAGIIQTVPSLALYGLLIIPLGLLKLPTLGAVPALIALSLYALLPIVRNTYLGVRGVDPAIIDAGRGMGMSGSELLWRVEMPLALPLVLEGLRASLVMTVGIAAVMAIAGSQDLGTLVFLGWGSTAADQVLLGAIPMVLLSIVADRGIRALEHAIVSPGIRPLHGQD
jgi:osmoprotectant transport system permease protein